MTSIAAIGECMLEFSRHSDGCYHLGFGGDTPNTAIYLSRLGCAVDYITALGDDVHSERLLAAWRDEGLGTGRVTTLPGRAPGLYLSETDAEGDRHFSYRRDTSAARDLFEGEPGEELAGALAEYDLIYLSGIILTLYQEGARERLWQGLDRARERGSRVAFDTHFRVRGWPRREVAHAAYVAMLQRTDILLSGIEDERALFGLDTIEVALRQARQRGIGETLVKQGATGCSVLADDYVATVAPARVEAVVDTTAAGDGFNAGYLAARLQGAMPEAACRAGHELTGVVIQHRGASVARAARAKVNGPSFGATGAFAG